MVTTGCHFGISCAYLGRGLGCFDRAAIAKDPLTPHPQAAIGFKGIGGTVARNHALIAITHFAGGRELAVRTVA
jgi:hypothetical protein